MSDERSDDPGGRGPGNASPVAPVLWFLDSPFFEATTMSPISLQRLQNALHFIEGPLFVLQTKDRLSEVKTFEHLSEDDKKIDVELQLKDSELDCCIVLLHHIFEHIAPNGLDPREKGIMRFSVGLSTENFCWLMSAMQVHPTILEVLHSHTGVMAIYESRDPENDNATYLHLLVKVPPGGHLEAAFYIQYDCSTKRVFAIVAGNDLDNHVQLLAEHFATSEPPYGPFALAAVLATRYFRFLEAQKVQVDHAVIMTERETGRGAVAYSDGRTTRAISPDKFDLTFMHWIEGNQRNIVYASEFQFKLAQWLVEEHMQHVQRRTATLFERHKLSRRENAIYERLKSHERMTEGLFKASLVIRERIQRQLSAADSIINQYDNKVSLKNAEASTNIAMQSARIADESKAIAAETRRDSTSMKTIASLTMVYLPSTFAASVFSTGFFSYQDGDGRKPLVKVNAQIWRLFAVASILSLVTMGVWIWLNKFGIPKQLNWARQKAEDETKKDDGSDKPQPDLQEVIASATITRPPLELVSHPRIDLPARPPGDEV